MNSLRSPALPNGVDVWGIAELGSQVDLSWIQTASPAGAGLNSLVQGYCFLDSSRDSATNCERLSHLAIAADVQLHNRDALFESFGISASAGSRIDDRQLLLLSYERWGGECPGYLLGEFAFAILDSRRRHLFCCRDHIGFRPFLYWSGGTRFAFASRSVAILAVPGVPRKLNPRKLAALKTFGGQDVYPEDTFHTGVMSLPPGSSLTVDASGIRKRTYWEPEIRPELVPRHPNDILEALRDLLFKALESRIGERSSVAATLSGGLDSSAIAAIAGKCLERKGRALLAIAGVVPQDRLNLYTDEREFIDEFRAFPNVRIEYVSASGSGPFDSIEDLSRFVATPQRGSRFYLHESIERAAVAGGAQILLEGFDGELGPSCWGERYCAELLTRFQWPTLIRELRQLRTIQGLHPLRYMAGQALELFPPVSRRRVKPYILLKDDFVRNYTPEPRTFFLPDQRKYQAFMIRNALGGAPPNRRGQTINGLVRTSQPLADKRVLEFCLAAPAAMKVRNGYRRYLIRGALDGVLPEKIQWRTTKGPFSPDYNYRYNAQLGKAREFVAAIGRTDPVRSVVDIDRLGGLLTPVDPGINSLAARVLVPATIYTICFLRQFPDFRQ